ncbi:hypothetical protein [Renibacterium salmoninarum]|nr:hypothetical protein [Renibacterium salmoninarum]
MVISRGDSSAGDSLKSTVPARRRASSSAFRKTLRLAAITGATGSAIFLIGVLGAQSANAATPDSTSAASQSASTSEGQGSGGLLGAIGNTLQGTVKVLENSVGSLLAPTPATPPMHEAKISGQPAAAVATVASTTPSATLSSTPWPTAPSTLIPAVDDKPALSAVKPVLTGVSDVLSPVLTPVTNTIRPVTSTTQPLVGGLVKTVTATVQGVTGTLIPTVEKLPILGQVLSPVIKSLTPTLNGLLPELTSDVPLVKDLTGSLTSQTGGLLPTGTPNLVPPVAPATPVSTPPRAQPLAPAVETVVAPSTIVEPVAELPAAVLAHSFVHQISSSAIFAYEVPVSNEATGSAPQGPLAPQPIEPIAAPASGTSSAGNGSSSAGSGASASATLSDIFAMPISVLSGTVGVPALILPEPLAYDPGSSPD